MSTFGNYEICIFVTRKILFGKTQNFLRRVFFKCPLLCIFGLFKKNFLIVSYSFLRVYIAIGCLISRVLFLIQLHLAFIPRFLKFSLVLPFFYYNLNSKFQLGFKRGHNYSFECASPISPHLFEPKTNRNTWEASLKGISETTHKQSGNRL